MYLSFLNFEKRLKYLSISQIFFCFDLSFFPGNSRPDDLSELFLLPAKMSSVCQLLTFICHRSHPGDQLPPVCICHRQYSVVVIVVRRSLTTSSQKYCVNITFSFGILHLYRKETERCEFHDSQPKGR